MYRNNPINEELLNELPENGSVLNYLTFQYEDKIQTNEEESSDEPEDVCKQHLGPEQGGSKDTTDLVDTDFIGPTNINNIEIEEENLMIFYVRM